jgi:three-Cys-motif partner protein
MSWEAIMPEHRFGGPWTEIKLDAVEYYLDCYTKALTKIKLFDLWYFDAFAGTGGREVEKVTGGLLDGTPIKREVETLEGSARRALQISSPFNHYVFIETNPGRYRQLEKLKKEFLNRDISCLNEDANEILKKIAASPEWMLERKSIRRGVVFLDPYSLQVEWSTLVALAQTQVMDVWYLFPLRDVTRQLAKNISGVGPKVDRLDRVLSPAWRELYKKIEMPDDLFGNSTTEVEIRTESKKGIENWFRKKMQKHFAFVSEPLPLWTTTAVQGFSLFLGVSNPRGVDLARKFVRYAMKPQASRRKSGR